MTMLLFFSTPGSTIQPVALNVTPKASTTRLGSREAPENGAASPPLVKALLSALDVTSHRPSHLRRT
jgi:hypothetical protein